MTNYQIRQLLLPLSAEDRKGRNIAELTKLLAQRIREWKEANGMGWWLRFREDPE
jgi:hypothetical protein